MSRVQHGLGYAESDRGWHRTIGCGGYDGTRPCDPHAPLSPRRSIPVHPGSGEFAPLAL